MKLYRDVRGYTIGEMMIAIVIGTMLIAAAAGTYIAQNRSYTTQESVSEINTQSKIAHDMISNDIKIAGFGVSDDMNADPISGYTNVITPVDRSTTSDPKTDAITIIGGFRRIGTLWPAGTSAESNLPCPSGSPTKISVSTDQISIILLPGSDGANTSDRSHLSIDGVDFVDVQSCTISDNNCTSGPITLDRPLTASYPLMDTDSDGKCNVGRPVYLVEDTTYCVDADSILRKIRGNANVQDCTGNTGSVNEPIAENIEDLQFAYALDDNNNGIDEDEDHDGMASDFNGDGRPDFINWPTGGDPSSIIAVRVSVLARADREDDNYAGQGNPPSSIENRIHSQTNDNYRRRLWQKTITVRNRWGE